MPTSYRVPNLLANVQMDDTIIPNANTTATSANTANAIVARDANGDIDVSDVGCSSLTCSGSLNLTSLSCSDAISSIKTTAGANTLTLQSDYASAGGSTKFAMKLFAPPTSTYHTFEVSNESGGLLIKRDAGADSTTFRSIKFMDYVDGVAQSPANYLTFDCKNQKIQLDSAYKLNLANTTASKLLMVDSSNNVISNDGTLSPSFVDITTTGKVYLADGSASVPSLTFASDTDTGFYRTGSNGIGIALQGALNAWFLPGTNIFYGNVTMQSAGDCSLRINANTDAVGTDDVPLFTLENNGSVIQSIGVNGSASSLPSAITGAAFSNMASNFQQYVSSTYVARWTTTELQMVAHLALTGGSKLRVENNNGGAEIMGKATLTNGTCTVSTTLIGSSSAAHVFLSRYNKNSSTAYGSLMVGTITSGTSFVVNSVKSDTTTETNDQSSFSWVILDAY